MQETFGGRILWGRVVGAGVALVLVIALGVVGLRALLSGDACVVTIGSTTTSLSTSQAEQASALIRRHPTDSLASLTKAVAKKTGLDTASARAATLALTGRARHALSCTHGGGDKTSDELDSAGLTARADHVREVISAEFGSLPTGGYAPGGVHTGHMVGSAHYEGRAVDVFFRPITKASKTRGWALAQYLVANADRLKIATVIFDAKIWTADRGDQGWRDYHLDLTGKPPKTARILLHRDHVHVDVPR